MGAALHLAEVHQAPPGPKRKRKGGGGSGDGYDKFVARIYRDPRMTPEARELILLLAWLVARDPDRFDMFGEPKGQVWTRAAAILGEYPTWGRKGSRLSDLIDADRPRYEPDKHAAVWQQRLCSAPMIRRAGECGQHAVSNALRVDLETGWRTPVWYCNRHRDFGRAAEAAFRSAPDVEPIPNTGGLMPSYLSTEHGDDGWIKIYRRASDWKCSRWEPPVKYGLRADKWPRPGEEQPTETVEPFRLRLAALDGELLGGGE
ncbi:hypothetical protein OG900_33115 [Streptomyces sp. NBC_00433]